MLIKFLIVDDSKAMQIIVKRVLEVAGYAEHEFRFADNGESAIQEIIKWQPDMVLLDWHMSGISGLKVLEKVNELQLQTKIGLITAEKNQLAIEQAKAAGAMFIVHKPFTRSDLQESLIPALAGVSTIKNDDGKLPSNKAIIFPSCSALSMLLSTVTRVSIKVETVEQWGIDQLVLPGKIALYGDRNKRNKIVQVMDSNLADRLSETFASSVFKDQAFDDKLFAKALLKASAVIAACFHDLSKEEELFPIKIFDMPKLMNKVISIDQRQNNGKLIFKYTFANNDAGYSIFYFDD